MGEKPVIDLRHKGADERKAMKAIIPAAGLGTRFLPATKCTPKEMLPVLDKPAGASVVAVAPCSPADVSRSGVIAGERVDTRGGFGGVAGDEPGAVWRVSGRVETPAAEEAPSNLYIVGRYLLSPLVMDLLADREPGKGGGPADRRHGPLARARGHVRRRHRPAVRLRHRHPVGLDRDQRPHGGLRPPLRRRVLGDRRRAREIGTQEVLVVSWHPFYCRGMHPAVTFVLAR